jgi:hypothetical protein
MLVYSIGGSYMLLQDESISFYEDANENQSNEESETKEEVKIKEEFFKEYCPNGSEIQRVQNKIFIVNNFNKSGLYLEIYSPPPES